MPNLQSLEGFPETLSIKDIAKIMGVGYSKARNTVLYGNMPYIKLGNSYRVWKGHFVKWLVNEEKRIFKFE